MAENETIEITAADTEELSRKLTTFSASLPPAQRALLTEALRRATDAGEDVQGFLLLDRLFGSLLNVDTADAPASGSVRVHGSAAAAWGFRTSTSATRPTFVAPPATPTR